MPFTSTDHTHMAQALRLAEKGLFTTDPNPRVGCVLVKGDQVVGRGWHHAAGQPHAEVLALQEAGAAARGATAYVTLEPCSHQGRTPPCTGALIEAEVGEVVAAMVDPFPDNAGHGLELLTRAGIQVRSGLMEAQARELNCGFVSRFERGRPWVRVKLAISLDGRIAGPDRRSQWITGSQAREDTQRWRARASALLTGIDTVLADDPSLNLRLSGIDRQPLRIIADSRGRTPSDAKLFSLPGKVLIATTVEPPWQLDGVEWWRLEGDDHGRVCLRSLIHGLADRQVNELHVEAGGVLAGALVAAGLVDELLIYQAPVIVGDGPAMLELPGMEKFAQRLHVNEIESRRIGSDRRVILRLKDE